jgi:hypothetical protein
VAVADLDGDDDVDLAVANTYSDDVSVLLNNGDGTFAAEFAYWSCDEPDALAAADLDGDLDVDLAIVNQGRHSEGPYSVSVLLDTCRNPGCPADFNGDGVVDVIDFLVLLGAWGPNPGHPADLDGSADVGVNDFLFLLANWGPSP